MIGKAAVILACLTLATADTIETYFSPASIGTASSFKLPNPKARPTPAPIYETEETNREIAASRANEQGFFTPFERAISETYDPRITHGTPYNPNIGRPISYYPTHSLIPNSESGPVTYTTHTHSSPLVGGYPTPLNIKTVPSGFNSRAPVNIGGKPNKIVYDAPSVSYVSVNGPGATYSW